MKNMTNNKITNFWIRLVARLIDLLCLIIIATISGWLFMKKNGDSNEVKTIFKTWWFFYVYAFIIILSIFFLFIALPMMWKGKTIGHFLTRTKIVSDINLQLGILKREIFWAWSWIFSVLSVVILINHTLVDKFALVSRSKDLALSNWDTMRISFVSSIAAIVCFIQMTFAISIIVKSNKIALHDIYSHTKTVYINKFVPIVKINDEVDEILKPQKVETIEINFIE